VSGIKRHIGVDTQGFPHAVCITTANLSEREGAILMITKEKEGLSDVSNLLVDGGYTGKPFADQAMELIGATVEVPKRK